MKHYTVSYGLRKGDEERWFSSEKAACEYLGVARCSVATCYGRGWTCKGYAVLRGNITTHHASKTRLYKIWDGMRDRCRRQGHMHYKNYGGRGITVCDEWLDFNEFKRWALDNGYNDQLTLDRIDCNGNYEPSNCRWATYEEQAANKRTNHIVNVNGETMILAECSRKYNIPKSTLRWREAHNRDLITGTRLQGSLEPGEDDADGE